MRKILLFSTAITITLIACKKDEAGCTDHMSINYNADAVIDDGSCIPFIYGCTDSTALNYNPLANTDNDSCTFNQGIPTNLTVDFTHTVDGNQFLLDLSSDIETLPYTNNAGQQYNIKRLWYIISDITLHAENGATLIKDIHFIDASETNTLSFMINDLENNNYTSISYTMGLNATRNISNSYINEDFHSKMFWPEPMGGGYHYMKLEGNFDNDSIFYNTHTGGAMGEDYSFNHTDIISLITDETTSEIKISINMEINNWYQNPNTITLSNNGIMGNIPIQMQMQQNGNDVFSSLIN